MARVTIEDCMEIVENRFALSVVAMKRAKQIVEKKVEALEKAKKMAEVSESEETTEIPSPEVVERSIDRSSQINEEHKPVLSALKEIAEGEIELSYPEGGKN